MKKVYLVESMCKILEHNKPYKLSHTVVADNEEDAKSILIGVIPRNMTISNVVEVDLSDNSKTRIIGR